MGPISKEGSGKTLLFQFAEGPVTGISISGIPVLWVLLSHPLMIGGVKEIW